MLIGAHNPLAFSWRELTTDWCAASSRSSTTEPKKPQIKTKLTLLIIAASITAAFASSIRFEAVVTEVGYPNPQNIRAGDVIDAHVTYNSHEQINALVLINGREVFKDRSAGLVITRPNCSEAHDVYYHLEGPVYVLVFDYAPDCPTVPPLDEFLLNQFFVQLYDRTPVYGKLTALP